MKKITLTLLHLCIVLFMQAQITIGTDEEVVHGALLQLKTDKNISDGNANSQKGLLLPRVELTSITDLFPMFPANYDKTKFDKQHAGLIVYNSNENLYNGDGEGLYDWDGTKWESVGLVKRDILAATKNIVLSEINPTASAEITTIPADQPFTMTSDGQESSNCLISGCHLDFEIDPNIYGMKHYTYTLDNSDKNVVINVDQLNLKINKSLFKVGENGTISSSAAVVATGGSQDWFVKSYTTEGLEWIDPPHNDNKALCFTLGTLSEPGTKEGIITVAHVDDPNYTKEITVSQNKDYIMLPVFDYLVIQYIYAMDQLPAGVSRVDLDTGTEITGTDIEGLDKQPVGWSLGSTRSFQGSNYLFWPGDNTQTGYESAYANMTMITENYLGQSLKREFNVDMYATWFYPSATQMGTQNLIKINITLYKGGTMSVVNTYDYKNTGGEKVFELLQTDMPVTTYQGRLTFRTSYTRMLRLEYDKEDNTGVLVPLPATISTDLLDDDAPEMKANETKEEYAKRIEKYIAKRKIK